MTTERKIRLINTKAHAVYDYVVGAILIVSPIIFGFQADAVAQKIMLAAALCIWLTTLMSKLEYGALPVISLSLHYTIDVLIGLALVASPWLFDFEEQVFKPHLVIGFSIMGVSLLSDRSLVREVKLMLTKNSPKPKSTRPKKQTSNFVTPVLKLVVDPFYYVNEKGKRKRNHFS